MVMKNVTKKIQKIPYLFLLMLFSFVTASAQKGITVRVQNVFRENIMDEIGRAHV